MVGIDITKLPFGYATFFQQGLELFDLAVMHAAYNVLNRDYSRHRGTPQGVKCNYASSCYAFATPAAVMSTLITVVDVANPRNVAKSPVSKSASGQIPPAVADA